MNNVLHHIANPRNIVANMDKAHNALHNELLSDLPWAWARLTGSFVIENCTMLSTALVRFQ